MNKYKILAIAFTLWSVASAASAATISLSPASGTYAPNDTFTVSVLLNTTGASIDGVDVRYLHFNPSMLQVVDSNTSSAGVQVAQGSLMPLTLTNTVDNSAGLLTFSQIVNAGQHYTGSGTLLNITFKAIASGSATITFDAASGKTTDTNVASAGADVLSSASSATFTISGNVTPASVSGSTGGAAGTTIPTIPTTPVVTTPIVAGTVPCDTTVTGSSASVTVALPRTISVGATGTDVTNLQNFLISLGYLPAGNNIGIFGQLTRKAVQAYQCAKGLVCSGDEGSTGYGLVGSKTRASMASGSVTTSTGCGSTTTGTVAKVTLSRTVYVGAKGDDIATMQNLLIAKGYLTAGNNTGFFGQLTRSAVQAYQCAKGLVCSGDEGSTGYGLVGAKTRALMNAEIQ